MTVLTPAPNTSTMLAQSSSQDILTLLSPALTSTLMLATHFQRLLSTTTLFIVLRAYFISSIILQQSFYASLLILAKTWYASSVLARSLCWSLYRGVGKGWKAMEPLRKKLFYEFMVFILGGGNVVLLVLFWPGWIFLGGFAGIVWWICG